MTDRTKSESLDRLQAAVAAQDATAISKFVSALEPAEAVHAISHLSELDQSRLLKALPRRVAARLVDDLPEAQAAQMIERLPSEDAAAIVSEMPSNEQADVIGRLSEVEASAILDAMPADEAEDARRLMSYPPDSAGGLMITEYLAYRDHLTVGDVLDDLRSHAGPLSPLRCAVCVCGFDAGKTGRRAATARLVALVPARAAVASHDRRSA